MGCFAGLWLFLYHRQGSVHSRKISECMFGTYISSSAVLVMIFFDFSFDSCLLSLTTFRARLCYQDLFDINAMTAKLHRRNFCIYQIMQALYALVLNHWPPLTPSDQLNRSQADDISNPTSTNRESPDGSAARHGVVARQSCATRAIDRHCVIAIRRRTLKRGPLS
jgi:hypothetical protein